MRFFLNRDDFYELVAWTVKTNPKLKLTTHCHLPFTQLTVGYFAAYSLYTSVASASVVEIR